jgi:molybdenum cofactor cytidylyltransferase
VGIEAVLNHPVEGALVWHVDRPHVAIATVEALLDRSRQGGEPIVVPSYQARRGHPVIFGRAVFEELLAVPDDQGARGVVRSDPSRVAVVPVDDPAVTEGIDTPEAYKELLRREDIR